MWLKGHMLSVLPMAVTLEQMLHSRDDRQALQRQYLDQHPGLTLMVLTVVMPGSDKRTDDSLTVAGAAVEAVHKEFGPQIRMFTERDLITGFEGWFMLETDARQAKRRACMLEDTHPLGRLFDLDVFDAASRAPLSRTELGLEQRRCLICERPARECMRSQAHSYAKILARIHQTVESYRDCL